MIRYRSALRSSLRPVLAAALLGIPTSSAAAGDPFADAVTAFVPGVGGTPGFNVPLATLGSPTRCTGEGFFPGVVSPFNPPYLIEEIISLGAGGSIVVEFFEPLLDDPANPFGIDLLIFGNTGFIDFDFPAGLIGGLFSDDGGVVEVSEDGVEFVLVEGAVADGLFPTLGYLDSGPFDLEPGLVQSDFTRPVAPAHGRMPLEGTDFATLVAMYDGSGGGAGIDLASTGLKAIRFVRVSVSVGSRLSVEIDAFSDVAAVGLFGDLDGDSLVNGADLGLLLAAWGEASPGDLDGNGVVDGADLGLLLAEWTP